MVDAADLKCFKTTNGLGGAITATQISHATPNNLFSNVPNNERVLGEDYYQCCYFKNTNANEAMDNFKLWLSQKSFPFDTQIKWAYDPLFIPSIKASTGASSNGYLDAGSETSLWSQAKTKFSFSIKVYFNTLDTSLGNRDIVRHDATSNHRFVLELSTTNLSFNIKNSSGVVISAAWPYSNITPKVWHEITCTYDNSLVSQNMKVFVDGNPVANNDLTQTINLIGNLFLGGSASSLDLDGNIRDFRWWTNTALTQQNITDLNNGNDSAVPRPDYHLKMDEGTGSPVDFISRTKTATLTGVAAWNTTPAQVIADKYTAPVGVTWKELGSEPETPDFLKLAAGASFPIWVWYHVNANAISRLDDSEIFSYALDIPQGGTGSGGGTGGGGTQPGYHYSPYGTFDSVSDCLQIADAPALDLNKFSISCWFRTTNNYAEFEGQMVHKGFGVYQTSADVKNYFIKINNDPYANSLEGGFEELDGTLHPVFTNGLTWNDGQWHFVVVTYDNIAVILYVDGVEKHRHNTSATPGTNARELYIGADPDDPTTESKRVFYGDLDEVRVYNDALTATEVANQWNNGVVPKTGNIVYENLFGGSGSGGTGGGGGTGGNPPPTPTNYKIAFASDWGCESETDDVIDLINDNGYNIIVSAGDNAYASASCFTNRFQALEAAGKVYGFAYGNHEYSESGGIAPYLSFFGHPRTYFTFKFQNFFFLIIDSNINMDPGSAQHNFILSELQRVQNDNTITWKAAIYHHPPYGSPSEHSYNDGESVEAFHSLFEQYGVQFILSAHNHNMQRSHQVVRNNSNPESPTVVDSTPPFVGNNHTVIEVISGAAGHDNPGSLYSLGSKPSFMAYQSNDYNGLWEMIASNNGNTLTCSFVDTDGEKYDTFIITAT